MLKLELNRKITIDADNSELYLDGASLWSNGTEEKLAELQAFIADLDSLDEWALYAVIDGKKGGGFKIVWENLIKNIQDTAAFAEATVEKTIGKKVTLNNALPYESLMSVVKDIQEHLQTGKKISKLDLFFHKPWKEIIETVQINGKCISSSEDCGVVCDTITLNQMRSEIAVLWNELITKNGGWFTQLGDNSEQICMKRIPKINQALNWYSDTFAEIKAKTLDAKFNIKNLFEIQEFNSEIEELKHLVTLTTEKIPIYIQLIKVTCFEMKEINASIDKNRVLLREGNWKIRQSAKSLSSPSMRGMLRIIKLLSRRWMNSTPNIIPGRSDYVSFNPSRHLHRTGPTTLKTVLVSMERIQFRITLKMRGSGSNSPA